MMFVLGIFTLQAQINPDTSYWKHGVVTGVTMTQVSYRDWAQGGENAFAWTATLEGKSTYEVQAYAWSNSYKLAYGNTKLSTQGIRKTDDKIDFESAFTYKMNAYVNPYVAASFKTQFAQGFDYSTTGGPTAISNFFDPAFLTQSAGFGYQPMPELKTRLGAAIREVITSEFTKYADDPKTIGQFEKTKVEGGVESVTEADMPVYDNIVFKAKLELFAPLKKFDEVIVRSDNTFAAKINQYFSANLNIQFIHEKPITPRTQVKQSIALGFSYVLL